MPINEAAVFREIIGAIGTASFPGSDRMARIIARNLAAAGESSDYAPAVHTHPSSDITDSGAFGRDLLATEDDASARVLLGLDGLTGGTLQIPILGSVAGTATAYTATSSVAPVAGQPYLFTPHVDCGASPSLNISVGGEPFGARGLRQQSGSQIRAKMLLAGFVYLATYNGTTFNVDGVVGTHQQFGNLSVFSNGGAIIWRVFKDGADAEPIYQITYNTDGEINVSTGPGGSTPPSIRQRIQPNGDTRFWGRMLVDAGVEVFSPRNPVLTYPDIMEWNAEAGGVTNARDMDPWVVQSGANHPFTPGGYHLNRPVRLPAGGSFVNLQHMPPNSAVVIDCMDAGSASRVYSGPGYTFLGQTDRVLTLAGPGLYRAHKGGAGKIVLAADAGSITTGASQTIPAHARVIAWMGQSWAQRAADHAVPGIQEVYRDASADYSTWSIDASSGASAMIDGNATIPDNFWWDTVTDAPGPKLLAAKAAVLADPLGASVTDVVWMYGGADIGQIADTGKTTFASMVATQLKINAWLRSAAGLNKSGLRMWFCPTPSKERSGISPDPAWYPVRRVFLEVAAQDPSGLSYRGIDYYADFRVLRDEHYGFMSMADQGRRLARRFRNVLNGANEPEGPKITSVTDLGGGATYRVRISRGEIGMERPALPIGFAFLPGGSDWITPTPIFPSGYAWGNDGTDYLDLTPETAGTGYRISYPYGCMEEAAQTSRVIRGSGSRSPLQTYHPTV